VAHRLIAPALRPRRVQLVVQEARPERLVAGWRCTLDVVLTDARRRPPVRSYSHLLGECGVGL
jgi:hypothetical protein